MSKDTLAESQGEKGVWTTWKTERKGKEQTEQGKGPARRRGSERWRKVRNRQGGDPEEEAGQGNGGRREWGVEGGTGQMGQESKGKKRGSRIEGGGRGGRTEDRQMEGTRRDRWEGGEADGERIREGREGRVGAAWKGGSRGKWGPQEQRRGQGQRGVRPNGGTEVGEAKPPRARPQEARRNGARRREGGEGPDGGAEFGVRKQRRPQEERGTESRRQTELPKRRRRWRSGVETQQGKRQRERELERAGGRPWGGERGGRVRGARRVLPALPPPARTGRWFHTGGCCTGRPQ